MTLTNFPYDPLLDLAPWVGQRQCTFRFRRINAVTGQDMGYVHPIRSNPTLTHDTSRTIKRQLNLSLGVQDTADVNPVQDRLLVFMVFPNGQEYPLGRYVFTSQSEQVFTSGELSNIVLNDEMFIIDQQVTQGVDAANLALSSTPGAPNFTTGTGQVNRGSAISRVLDILLQDFDVQVEIEGSPFVINQAWAAGAQRGQIVEAMALAGDYFCLAPETPVLTAELAWERVDSLRLGQEIIGFDESDSGPSQRYRRATVDSLACRTLPSYEILTPYGPVVASAEHMWLTVAPKVRRGGFHRQWKRTADLLPGDKIVAFGQPWATDTSRDAGYLAGVYDGEGSLAIPGGRGAHTSKVPRATFGQNPGIVLDEVKRLLDDKGFLYRETQPKNLRIHHLVHKGGKYETMRFLGTIRPKRLLAKSASLWEDRATWSVAEDCENSVRVLDVVPVGDRHVIAIGTSTKTLVANGLLSHNSPWFDNNGTMQFIRAFNPALQIPDFDWDAGNQVMRSSIVRQSDILNAPNRFVVISNSSAEFGTPIFGSADVPVNAPNSFENRGFYVPRVVDLQALTVQQCQAMAENLMQRQTIFETTTLTTAPDPRHDSYNVINWQGVLWLELAWSMTLSEGAPMSHTLRRAYQ